VRTKLAGLLVLGTACGIWSCGSEDTTPTGSEGAAGSSGMPSGSGGSVSGTGGSGVGGALGSGGAGVGGSGVGGDLAGLGGSGVGGGAVGTGGSGVGGDLVGSGGSGVGGTAGAGGEGTGGAGTGGDGTGGEGTGGDGSGGDGTGGEGTGGDGSGGDGTGGASPTEFDNPIIKYDAPDPTSGPGEYIYTADPAAMIWNNRLYLYTSHDEQIVGGDDYRMYDYRLWSSTDMVSWQNHGAVLRFSDVPWAREGADTGNAYACHVTYREDANGQTKFYFYATLEGGNEPDWGFSVGVAVGDSPEGPFVDPRGMPMILLTDTEAYASHTWRNIDPAVFIDDDGQAYLYWGNGNLYWVELEDDMIHLKGESYSLDNNGLMQDRDISGVELHVVDIPAFEEAPYLSKHGDLYYLTYASGFPESIAYATSTSPRGPWEYRGVIMDPIQGTGTIHPALFEFNGATYLAYHNAALPDGGDYRRSVCVDRAYFNGDGSIQPVVQTSM
jgi:hypothetical protein